MSFPTTLKLACFDMDSTLIKNECINEMARQCDLKPNAIGGCYDAVQAITSAAMNDAANPITFEESLAERINIIANHGFTQDDLPACFKRLQLMEGAQALLAYLKETDVRCVLVSGGFSQFVAKVVGTLEEGKLPFDATYCNTLTFHEDGRLKRVEGDAKLQGAIVGKEAKLAALKQEANSLGIPLAECAMTGDGGNDALAVGAVTIAGGKGVAFHATNAELLAASNIKISHEQNLSSLIPPNERATFINRFKEYYPKTLGI